MNVIAGDFNCPNISWDNLQCYTDRTHPLLLSCVIDCGLTQVVDFNTRLQNVLDIVLTDEPQRILKVTSKPPLGQSDHDMLKFDVMVDDQLSSHDSTPLLRYQWHLMDCVAANNYLRNIDWYSVICVNPSPDSMWSAFMNIMNDVTNLFVPVKKIRTRS